MAQLYMTATDRQSDSGQTEAQTDSCTSMRQPGLSIIERPLRGPQSDVSGQVLVHYTHCCGVNCTWQNGKWSAVSPAQLQHPLPMPPHSLRPLSALGADVAQLK